MKIPCSKCKGDGVITMINYKNIKKADELTAVNEVIFSCPQCKGTGLMEAGWKNKEDK